MKNKKEKKQIQWEKQIADSVMSWKELRVGAIWEGIAMLLLLFDTIFILQQVSRSAGLGAGSFLVFVAVAVTTFFYEFLLRLVFIRIDNKDKRRLVQLLSKVLPAILLFISFIKYWKEHGEELIGGLKQLILEFLNAYNYLYHAKLSVVGAAKDELPRFLTFATLLLFFVFFLLSKTGQRKWLFVLCPLTVIVVIMYFGKAPSFSQFFVALLGTFMIYKSHRRKAELYVSAAVTAVILCAVLGMIGLFARGYAENLLSKSYEAKKMQKELETNLSSVKDRIQDPFLPKKEAVVNSAPKFQDKKVMTIKLDQKPETSLYFQDFYGTTYRDGEWTDPAGSFATACAEHGITQQEASRYLASSLFECMSAHGQPLGYQVARFQVGYQGMLQEALLLPYAVDGKDLAGVTFSKERIAKRQAFQQKAVFQAWNANLFDNDVLFLGSARTAGELSEKEREVWAWYKEYVKETCLAYPSYVDELPIGRSVKQMPLTTLPLSSYVFLGDKNLAEWRINYAKGTCNVLNGNNSRYSWDLDVLKEGEDPIRHFLEKENGRKGYCTHFASAGVFLLRSIGIPARFASGYVVKPSAFKEQEDGSYVAEVIDRNGHAWAEIFLDDIGWIPVEMTPGYDSSLTKMPTSKEEAEARKEAHLSTQDEIQESQSVSGQSEETEASEETKESEEIKESKEAEESGESKQSEGQKGQRKDSKEGTGDKEAEDAEDTAPFGKRAIWIFAGIATVALLAGLAYYLGTRNQRAERKLKKTLRGRYYKAAVMMMNRRIYQQLNIRKKVKKQFVKDKDYEAVLVTLMGQEKAPEIAEYMRVAKAAAFSGGNLSKEDCILAWRFYQKVKHLPSTSKKA